MRAGPILNQATCETTATPAAEVAAVCADALFRLDEQAQRSLDASRVGR
jgi:hypothetical protein